MQRIGIAVADPLNSERLLFTGENRQDIKGSEGNVTIVSATVLGCTGFKIDSLQCPECWRNVLQGQIGDSYPLPLCIVIH
jgi:hypothetical protein